MNEVLTGLVDTSDNLGELHMDGREFRMVFEIRSAQDSLKYYIYEKIQRLSSLVGAKCKTRKLSTQAGISGQIRRFVKLRWRFTKRNTVPEPTVLTVHAGLEVGCFFEVKPSLDAISLGPDCWNFHSPSEMVSIPSVRKAYGFLCSILEELK